MNNKSSKFDERILITTPIKLTWPSNKEKVIFLGEWCKLFKDRQLIEKYDQVTPHYHWDKNEKFKRDYKNINLIYENLLVLISDKLNIIHKLDLSYSSWRIIIGPWLGIFSQVVFDRWYTLKKAYQNYPISHTVCINYDLENQIPNDFESFMNKCTQDVFNHIIYSEIIKILGFKTIIVNPKIINKESNLFKKFRKLKFKKYLAYFLYRFSQFGSIYDNYLIIDTCLNRYRNALLQIKLKQFPRVWGGKLRIPNFDIDLNKRQWEIVQYENFKEEELQEYTKILVKLIPLFIPRSYLEGFDFLNSHFINNIWPKSPEKIFTSGKQISDDIFKVWCAKKIKDGSELFIGQHGGHYKSSSISFLEDHQNLICKKFMGWGDKHNVGKMKSIGLFISDFYKLKIKPKNNGDILLIENEVSRYSMWMWSGLKNANHWIEYFSFNSTLIKNLPSRIRKKSTIRIYNKANYGYSSVERWKDEIKNIKIDYCKQTLEKSLKNARIAISTTNTSTMLFTLCINFPTIVYWQKNLWEIKEDSKKYFDELERVGILQTNPVNAIKHINEIWDNVNEWWNDKETQRIRKRFCNQFAKNNNLDLDLLTDYLKY